MKYINKTVVDLVEAISDKITLCDIYAADAISEVTVAIIKKRLSMDLTQKDFGKLLGVTPNVVAKWENGNYNFSLKLIAYICAKLNLTLSINFKQPEQKQE